MIKRLKRVWTHIKEENSSSDKLGWAMAVGLFIGFSPLYGLHFLLALAAAWAFKLNKATVYLAASISNPILAPFILWGGVMLGERIRYGQSTTSLIDVKVILTDVGSVSDLFLSCLLGTTILGLIFGAAGGFATRLVVKRLRRGGTIEGGS